MLTIDDKITVSVVGAIKSGKGLFTKKAFEPNNSKILLETILLGNYWVPPRQVHIEEKSDKETIEDFYRDEKAHALRLETSFLAYRLQQQSQVDASAGLVFMGQHPDVDRIFAEINKENLGRDFLAYELLFNETRKRITDPDVVIFLKASEETLRRRISEKGTHGEQKLLEGTYLHKNMEGLERYCEELKEPAIVVNADEPFFDGKWDEKFWGELFTRVAQEIRQKKSPPRLTRQEWGKVDYNRARAASWEAMKQLGRFAQKEQLYLAIMGIIGVGKTGVAERLRDELGIYILRELPGSNDRIQDQYYANFLGSLKYEKTNPELVQEHCYKLQDYLLSKRLESITTMYNQGKSFVVDRSPVEDQSIFWRYFLQQGWLSEEQYLDLQKRAIKAYAQTPKSNVLIRLDLPAEKARERILDRGRKEEVAAWTLQRLKSIETNYGDIDQDMLQYHSHEGPVTRVDMETFNAKDEIDRAHLYQEILHCILKHRGI